MIRTTVATAFLLAGCVGLQRPAKAEEFDVQAELVAVAPGPGCGVLLTGSPATYLVTSGHDGLRGKQVHVLIACIEMPLSQGDVSDFVVGARHHLILTRQNVHRIEVPSRLPDATWFYLKAASVHGSGETEASGDPV